MFVKNGTTITNNVTYVYTNSFQVNCIDDRNGDGQFTSYPGIGYTESAITGCNFQIAYNSPINGTQIINSNELSSTSYDFKGQRFPGGSYTITKLSNAPNKTNTNAQKYGAFNNPSGSVLTNYGNVTSIPFTLSNGTINQTALYNFFQFQAPITNNASVTGLLFNDKELDGFYQVNGNDGNPLTLEDNDTILASSPVALTGTATKSAITDSNGKYQFTDLAQGPYNITVTGFSQNPLIKYSNINNIGITSGGLDYSVSFNYVGFTNGTTYKTKFYWNNQSATSTGTIYTNSSPYVLPINSKPVGATKLCVVIVNATNAILPGTGNCKNIP
jgi:hypothetical protein